MSSISARRASCSTTTCSARRASSSHLALRRRDAVEAGKAERVEPRATDRSVAIEDGAGRGVLALEGILDGDAPQPAVLECPLLAIVQQDGRPHPFLPWTDADAIAAGVVDEGDRQQALPVRIVGAAVEQPPDGIRDDVHPARQPKLLLRLVLPWHEVRRVRPGAGEDDRMAVDHLQLLCVVPAPPKGLAVVVVLRVGRPARHGLALVLRREEERDLLPIGLVVVGAMERASPVVEGVEEPVLQHRPAGIAKDAAVIRVRAIVGGGAVPQGRAASDAAGHPAAQQQRAGKQGIGEARQVTDPRQATRPAPEALSLRPADPAGLRAPSRQPTPRSPHSGMCARRPLRPARPGGPH